MAEVVCVQGNDAVSVAQSLSFQSQCEPKDYIVERGLFVEYSNGVAIDLGGYNFMVKGPGSKSLVETIDEKVQSVGQARLLDVGCGAGRFLTDCASRWSGLISLHGLTAYFYNRIFDKVSLETTQQAIDRLGIEVKRGDAQKLANHYSPNQFDIVTAVKVAPYLEDPWALVKGIDYVLKPGGVGYINHLFPLLSDPEYRNQTVAGLSDEELFALRLFFEEDGRFETRFGCNLVYKKTQDPLNIPIDYAVPILQTEDSSSRIRYRFLI